MRRKDILILIGCVLSMSLVLAGMYSVSSLGSDLYRASFDRRFRSEPVYGQKDVLNLPFNSYYIAGTSAQHVYLGNWTGPLDAIVVNLQSLDTQHVRLTIEDPGKINNYESFRLKIDSPVFFLTNGNLPGVYKGRISDWHAERITRPSTYFVDAVPITTSSFALRSYSKKSEGFELAREKIDSPRFEFQYGLLEKQIDGLFCVSGMLHFDKVSRKLVYLYTYRNQYMVMDTAMNLIYRANTIDTFSHARIKVAHIRSSNENVLSRPPVVINSKSCVSGNLLFVNSNLMARNEDQETFVNGSVFDIYDLQDGSYVNSFHLPRSDNKGLSDFAIRGEWLVSLYDRDLVIYRLREESDQSDIDAFPKELLSE